MTRVLLGTHPTLTRPSLLLGTCAWLLPEAAQAARPSLSRVVCAQSTWPTLSLFMIALASPRAELW